MPDVVSNVLPVEKVDVSDQSGNDIRADHFLRVCFIDWREEQGHSIGIQECILLSEVFGELESAFFLGSVLFEGVGKSSQVFGRLSVHFFDQFVLFDWASVFFCDLKSILLS